MLTDVSLCQNPIGLGYAHDLNVRTLVGFKDPTHMAMIQSGHTYPEDFFLRKSRRNPKQEYTTYPFFHMGKLGILG